MLKKTVLTLTTLLVSSTALATSKPKSVEIKETTNFIVTPSVAYRYDVFKWAIPSDRFPQNKLSELIWKNHIIQPSIKIEIEPKPDQFTFLGQVKYGYILKNQSKSWDYDWFGNHRYNQPFSKTLSSVKGNILDLSGAIGYSVNLFNNNLLTFYIGYDYTDYRNKNYGIRQLANNSNKLEKSFNQLVSKYYFNTQSPWVGLSVKATLNDKFSIVPTIKYYSFKYVGKGYWLLRYDLAQDPSFKHNAKGKGLGFDVDLLYKFSDNLDFKFNIESKKLTMKSGGVKTFFSEKTKKSALFNIGEKVSDINKLYNLNIISSSISIGLKCKL